MYHNINNSLKATILVMMANRNKNHLIIFEAISEAERFYLILFSCFSKVNMCTLFWKYTDFILWSMFLISILFWITWRSHVQAHLGHALHSAMSWEMLSKIAMIDELCLSIWGRPWRQLNANKTLGGEKDGRLTHNCRAVMFFSGYSQKKITELDCSYVCSIQARKLEVIVKYMRYRNI